MPSRAGSLGLGLLSGFGGLCLEGFFKQGLSGLWLTEFIRFIDVNRAYRHYGLQGLAPRLVASDYIYMANISTPLCHEDSALVFLVNPKP